MNQRLQKILSDRGVASRRKAEEMISAGRVTVNGQVALLGSSADADLDDIRVDSQPLPAAAGYIYLMLNKPRGYVTTLSDEKADRRRHSWWRTAASGCTRLGGWTWIPRGCCCLPMTVRLQIA